MLVLLHVPLRDRAAFHSASDSEHWTLLRLHHHNKLTIHMQAFCQLKVLRSMASIRLIRHNQQGPPWFARRLHVGRGGAMPSNISSPRNLPVLVVSLSLSLSLSHGNNSEGVFSFTNKLDLESDESQ